MGGLAAAEGESVYSRRFETTSGSLIKPSKNSALNAAGTMNCVRVAIVCFCVVHRLCAQTVDYQHAPGSPLKLTGGGHNFVVADVDKDGHVDLDVARGDKLIVLLGDGKGGFVAAPVPPT